MVDADAPNPQPDAAADTLEALAAEYLDRQRRGESPSTAQYAAAHPELAEEIHELFPTLAAVEELKANRERSEGGRASLGALRPERLGDFRIIRELGRGGMGIVYEAEQESLGRHVAIKVLPRQTLLDAKHLGRFQREAQVAAGLHHTNIVQVFGVGEQEGFHYYVMQLVRGAGLDKVVNHLGGKKKKTKTEDEDEDEDDYEGKKTEEREEAEDEDEKEEEGNKRKETAEDEKRGTEQAGEGVPGDTIVEGICRRLVGDGSAPTEPRPAPLAPTPSGVATADTVVEGICRRRIGDGAGPTEPALVPPSAGTALDEAFVEGICRQLMGQGQAADRWRGVAKVGLQMAGALDYAHRQGALHRDIKPANLLADEQGTVWLTDFGLAKAAQSVDVTQPGDLTGTLRYMAPEQFHGTCDRRSDVYSLGVTLYELLVLRPAFRAADHSSLIRAVTQSDPPRPRQVDRRVPRDLETIILKAIAREPAHRYASAGELAADLRRFLEDRPVRARRAGAAERLWRWGRRNPVVAALSCATLLLVLAVAGLASADYVRTRQSLQREAQQRRRAEAIATLAQEALDRIFDRMGPIRTPRRAELPMGGALASAGAGAAGTGATTTAPAGAGGAAGSAAAAAGQTTAATTVEVYSAPVLSKETAALLEEMLPFYERLGRQLGEGGTAGSEWLLRAAQANRRVGDIRQRLGQYDRAIAAYTQAVAIYRRMGAGGATVAETLNELGRAYRLKRQLPEAAASHKQALALLEACSAEASSSPGVRLELARTYYFLGTPMPEEPADGPPGARGDGRDGRGGQRGGPRGMIRGGDRPEPPGTPPGDNPPGRRMDGPPPAGTERFGPRTAVWGSGIFLPPLRDEMEGKWPRNLLPEIAGPPNSPGGPREPDWREKGVRSLFPELPGHESGPNGQRDAGREGVRPEKAPDPFFPRFSHDQERKYLAKAVELLDGLIAEHPADPAYRHLLALCCRDGRRAMGPPSRQTVQAAMDRAVAILEQLVREFPDATDYRFDLCETYALAEPEAFFPGPGPRPGRDGGTGGRGTGVSPVGPMGVPPMDPLATRVGDPKEDSTGGTPVRPTGKMPVPPSDASGQGPRSEQLSAAETRLRKALAIAQDLVARHPNVPEYQACQANIHHKLAGVLRGTRRPEEAEQAARQAVAIQARLVQQLPDLTSHQVLLAAFRNSLADMLLARQKAEEARSLAGDAIADAEAVLKAHPDMWFLHGLLMDAHRIQAAALRSTGQPVPAAEADRQADQHRRDLRPPPGAGMVMGAAPGMGPGAEPARGPWQGPTPNPSRAPRPTSPPASRPDRV